MDETECPRWVDLNEVSYLDGDVAGDGPCNTLGAQKRRLTPSPAAQVTKVARRMEDENGCCKPYYVQERRDFTNEEKSKTMIYTEEIFSRISELKDKIQKYEANNLHFEAGKDAENTIFCYQWKTS